METISFDSRLIAQAAFDRDARVLVVQLTNGSLEKHRGVSEKKFMAFAESASPGSYYVNHIIPFYRRPLFRKVSIGLAGVVSTLFALRFMGFLGG